MKAILSPFRAIAFMALIALLSLGFVSCNSDDDGPVIYNVQEFATFVGNDMGRAKFAVQRTGNGPTYDLYATGSVSDKIPAGSRILLAYQLQSEYNSSGVADVVLPTSGEIAVISVQAILTLTPKVVNMEADSVADWAVTPLYLDQLNRTGAYINMIARAKVNQNQLSKTFDLYADSASMATNEPKLYLRYNEQDLDAQLYNVPASLDLANVVMPNGEKAPLWNNTSYVGVELNVKNSKTTKNTFQFLRSQENYTE